MVMKLLDKSTHLNNLIVSRAFFMWWVYISEIFIIIVIIIYNYSQNGRWLDGSLEYGVHLAKIFYILYTYLCRVESDDTRQFSW